MSSTHKEEENLDRRDKAQKMGDDWLNRDIQIRMRKEKLKEQGNKCCDQCEASVNPNDPSETETTCRDKNCSCHREGWEDIKKKLRASSLGIRLWESNRFNDQLFEDTAKYIASEISLAIKELGTKLIKGNFHEITGPNGQCECGEEKGSCGVRLDAMVSLAFKEERTRIAGMVSEMKKDEKGHWEVEDKVELALIHGYNQALSDIAAHLESEGSLEDKG